ncbi:MAG: hypothetical protein ACJ8CB_04965 [Ktedonobacteraceae bacterium]|jgi:hypothetical protein
MTSKHAARARSKALANCAQDWHQWHPTFSLGEKLYAKGGTRYDPVARAPDSAPSQANVLRASPLGSASSRV